MLLQWRHNESDGISNHRRLDCLFKPLFRRRSKKTPKLRVTGLCGGNIPVTGERASNAENDSIWWRHHAYIVSLQPLPADHSGKHQALQLQISRLSRVGVTASPSSVLLPAWFFRKKGNNLTSNVSWTCAEIYLALHKIIRTTLY